MIIYNKEILKKIKNWTADNIHIVTDFDRTITDGNSIASWAVLSKSNLVPKTYINDRQKLFTHYRPIELDENMPKKKKNKQMRKWWGEHINLLIKYKISDKIIEDAAHNLEVMKFRKGAKEFLESMHQKQIPVIILSAGIGNFIKAFLRKNDCDYDNIHIISNFLTFEKGIASGISGNIIHSLNKSEVSLKPIIQNEIKDRPNIILLGDSISDIQMIKEADREKALKIGFLEEKEENLEIYKQNFDIVCTKNTSFSDLEKEIKILKE